jgi:hypothetical protein
MVESSTLSRDNPIVILPVSTGNHAYNQILETTTSNFVSKYRRNKAPPRSFGVEVSFVIEKNIESPSINSPGPYALGGVVIAQLFSESAEIEASTMFRTFYRCE